MRLRLFLSCWIVFALHFATDFVREHYLVVSIVEDGSYQLDQYYGLHVDIFQNPPHAPVQGAHHGANPGVSMLAAVPYFLTKPAVDWVVDRELAGRRARGDTGTGEYRDNRPRRVAFYQAARRMGLDVRFGLVGAITQALCMAPLSAASVVLMYSLLLAIGVGQRRSIWLSLLYAFGTPLFLRTGYLNQNLALGFMTFAGFALIWNPGLVAWRERTRLLVAGLLGGGAFLFDYSGAVLMGLVGLYAWWRLSEDAGWWRGMGRSLWYAAGCVPGVLLLWHYQWASFGHPFYPPQHWMPPVEWIEIGYQGVGGIEPELIGLLLASPSYGLLVTMPIAALAVAAPWLARRGRGPLPRREALTLVAIGLSFVLFFATVQYTRLQWVTGIRYLAALVPFLFLAAVPVLLALPRAVTAALAVASVTINWSLAMVRNQGTVLDNVQRVLLDGFQLPWLTTLSKMTAQYAPWLQGRPSVLPLFVLAGIAIALIWRVSDPWKPLVGEGAGGPGAGG